MCVHVFFPRPNIPVHTVVSQKEENAIEETEDSKKGEDWIRNVQENENRWKGKTFFGIEGSMLRYKETDI